VSGALQALITGLATRRASYGLIALGFSLVHRLTGVITAALLWYADQTA
jgi:hypothetical protein